VEAIAAAIRTLLPEGWQCEISGEFTAHGDQFHLLLRINNDVIFVGSETGTEAVTKLIDQGAFQIVTATQPYVAAFALFGQDDFPRAREAADRIIDSSPPTNENVRWAINLKGTIAAKLGDTDGAIAAYQTAIDHYQDFAVPHYNLGMIWENANKIDDAIGEYQTAVRLDPQYAWPHNSLGFCWLMKHNLDKALDEFQTATRLSPEIAPFHYNLGYTLASKSRFKEAIDEIQTSIRLDPRNVSTWFRQHFTLGLALQQFSATKATPSERLKLQREACVAFTKAATLEQQYSPGSRASMQEVDAEMQGQGRCPPEKTSSSKG
jgi:tetratricopeptide (TPR) repeat protein